MTFPRILRSLLVLAAILVAGCGNRLPYDELAADARGDAPAEPARPGSAGAPSGSTATSGRGPTATGTESPGPEVPGATGGAGTSGDVDATTGAAVDPPVASCTGNEVPITIGSVGEQSGPIGSIIRTGPQAVQAWVAMVNARGGLNCHQIRYIIVDDGGDPARNQALTRQLVEQEGVIAFVHSNAPLAGAASVDYLNQRGIPSIGNEGASPWFNTSQLHFPQASTGDANIYAAVGGVAAQARAQGLSNLGLVSCIEAAICSSAYDKAADIAQRFGMNLAYRAKVSLVQPDFTSLCQSMQSANVEVVFAAVDGNSYNRLSRSCSSVNFRPVYGTGGPIASEGVVQDPTLDGLLLGSAVIPQTHTANAGVAEFRDALAEFAPGVPADGAAVNGWVSAKLFELAAQNLAETPTSQDILNGLWVISGHDLGGMTAPLTFAQGQTATVGACYFQAYVRDAQVHAAADGARTCL